MQLTLPTQHRVSQVQLIAPKYILLRFILMLSSSLFLGLLDGFRDMLLCNLVEVDWRFRGGYCLHHQGALMMEAVSMLPLKRRSTSTRLKLKLSHCTPWRRLGGEEVQLLLILDLGIRWGEWSGSRPGRALTPGKGPTVPTVQEAGWAPEPVWTPRPVENSSRLCRGSNLDCPVVQPVARHYTDWASRLTSTGLQGAIWQKTVIFILAAMITRNIPNSRIFPQFPIDARDANMAAVTWPVWGRRALPVLASGLGDAGRRQGRVQPARHVQ
jgi:hypothetical protein